MMQATLAGLCGAIAMAGVTYSAPAAPLRYFFQSLLLILVLLVIVLAVIALRAD